ncbi:hypothetical protein ACYPKM_01475 [Pseudomonas aeruginosa]
MNVEVVQRIDSLEVIIGVLGDMPAHPMATPYMALLQRTWAELTIIGRRDAVADEEFRRMFDQESDVQLLCSPCIPPPGYLLRKNDCDELLTEDHVVWCEPEQAWIRPLPSVIGKYVGTAGGSALQLPEDDRFRDWDKDQLSKALTGANAAVAYINGLERLNPFIPDSELYNAFERGWRMGESGSLS